jgi:hypothetical protein
MNQYLLDNLTSSHQLHYGVMNHRVAPPKNQQPRTPATQRHNAIHRMNRRIAVSPAIATPSKAAELPASGTGKLLADALLTSNNSIARVNPIFVSVFFVSIYLSSLVFRTHWSL